MRIPEIAPWHRTSALLPPYTDQHTALTHRGMTPPPPPLQAHNPCSPSPADRQHRRRPKEQPQRQRQHPATAWLVVHILVLGSLWALLEYSDALFGSLWGYRQIAGFEAGRAGASPFPQNRRCPPWFKHSTSVFRRRVSRSATTTA
jgi:hypothetical protein